MFALRASKVLVSLFAIDLGASVFAIGVLVAAYSAFPLLLALYAGKISDRLGVRLPMVAGSAGLACGLLVPYFAPSLGGLYVSAALIGACFVFYNVSIQQLIGLLSGPHERTRNYSNYSVAVSVGSFLGPLAAGFGIDTVGHARTYLLLAAAPLVPIAILAVSGAGRPRAARALGESPRRSSADLWRDRELRRVLLVSGAILTGIDLYDFYMPVYSRSAGMSASAIGVVISMYAVAAFVVRTAIPALARRAGEEALITYAMFMGALGFVALPFFHDPWTLGALSFALGLALGCGQPLSMTLTYARSPADRTGEALGLRLAINNFMHFSVPLVFGSIGSILGLAPVFWINSAMLAASGWLSRRAAPPASRS